MKRILAAGLAGFLAACASASAPGGDGFVPLFNGRDLAGWQTGPDNAWVVECGFR